MTNQIHSISTAEKVPPIFHFFSSFLNIKLDKLLMPVDAEFLIVEVHLNLLLLCIASTCLGFYIHSKLKYLLLAKTAWGRRHLDRRHMPITLNAFLNRIMMWCLFFIFGFFGGIIMAEYIWQEHLVKNTKATANHYNFSMFVIWMSCFVTPIIIPRMPGLLHAMILRLRALTMEDLFNFKKVLSKYKIIVKLKKDK